MTADLEFGAVGDHGTSATQSAAGGQGAAGQGAAGQGGAGRAAGLAGQPLRSPAMRAYCATLARFTSSVQSTEQLLRNDDAGTREDTEQRELTATSRLRGIDRAALAADDGLDHCAAVRSAHGLPLPPATWGTDESPEYGADRPDPSDGASLVAGGRDLRRSTSDDGRGPVPHGLGRPGSSDSYVESADGGGWAGAGDGRGPRPGGLDRPGPSDLYIGPSDGWATGTSKGRSPRPGGLDRIGASDPRTELRDGGGWAAGPGDGRGPHPGGLDRPGPSDLYIGPSDGWATGTSKGRSPRPGGLDRIGASDPRTELRDGGGWAAGPGDGRGPRPGGLDRTDASDPRAGTGDGGGWAAGPAGLDRLRSADHGAEANDHSVRDPHPRTTSQGAGLDRLRPSGLDPAPDERSDRPAGSRNGRGPRLGEPGDSGSRATDPGHAGGPHPSTTGTTGTTSQSTGLDRLRRSGGGADLGVALTSLGRRRDALRLAEEEFAGWLAARDEQTRRISLGAAVGAGLAGAAVMVVAGTRTSAAVSLALLAACTLAVVAVGVGVAVARKSPQVCRGAGLARRPHPLGLARYAAKVGGLALLALAAANIGAGAL